MSQKNNYQLIYKEVKERLKDQISSINILDTKSGITLALIGTFVGALTNSNWFINLPFYFLLPILLGFGITSYFSLREILASDFRKDPSPSNLIKNYADKEYLQTLTQLISNFNDSFNQNESKITLKKRYLNLSFISIFITIVVLLISIFFSKNNLIIQKIN